MRKATHETNSSFLFFAILFSITVSLYCLIVDEYFFSFVSTQYRNTNPTTQLLCQSLNLKFFIEQNVKDYLSNPLKLKLGYKPTDLKKI